MQGRRISASPPTLGPFLLTIPVHPAMEDAHTAVLTLEDGTQEKDAFFGVYDGHSGDLLPPFPSSLSNPSLTRSTVAKFAGKNIPARVFLRRKLIARSATTGYEKGLSGNHRRPSRRYATPWSFDDRYLTPIRAHCVASGLASGDDEASFFSNIHHI